MFANRVAGLHDYQFMCGNGLAVRPSGTIGAAIAPGNNTYGSYTQVLSSSDVSKDLVGLWLMFHSGSTAAAARDIIATIGVDPAGGTSYTEVIPHLLVSCCDAYSNAGTQFFFPIRIKSGSSVGCKGSVNNATVGTFRVLAQGFGVPRNEMECRAGSRVEAIGAVTASSCGTAVTPGTTSEGSWTDLGTLTYDAWWLQCGMGCNNSAMTFVQYHMDLAVGDASNKQIVMQDILVRTTGSETLGMPYQPSPNQVIAKAGEHVYGRLQCSGTADSGITMAAYALS